MSDNAFGGQTDDNDQPRTGPGTQPGGQEPTSSAPDDASELLDGSLGEAPAEPKTGSDSAFAGDVGDALPGGDQPGGDQPETETGSAIDARVASLTGDLQRVNAEYVNYRRRVERDKEASRAATIGSVVESLIPVLDDIFAARQHGELEDGPFAKIAEKLEQILSRYGVAQVGAEGETFDPAIHEALITMQAELPAGTTETTVVKVMQPGFMVGERLVRAARVGVAEPGPDAPAPGTVDLTPQAESAVPTEHADPEKVDADGDGIDDAGFTPAPGCDA